MYATQLNSRAIYANVGIRYSVFDSMLSCGNPTVVEETKASATMSADVKASLDINLSTKSSTVTKGETKMKKRTSHKTDTVTIRAKASVVFSIIAGLAFTLLTASSILNVSSHG